MGIHPDLLKTFLALSFIICFLLLEERFRAASTTWLLNPNYGRGAQSTKVSILDKNVFCSHLYQTGFNCRL